MKPPEDAPENTTVFPCPLSGLGESREFLQSAFWGCFKSDFGWKSRGFEWSFQGCGGRVLVMERRLPGGVSFAYVPYGPDIPAGLEPADSALLLSGLARGMESSLWPTCLFVRFDLTAGTRGKLGTPEAELWPPPLPLPLKPSPVRVQPRHSLIINLEPDEEAILSAMSRKTRYNIRLAARKGLQIQSFDTQEAIEHIASWYELHRETAVRDKISIYPVSYYQRLFSLCLEKKEGLGALDVISGGGKAPDSVEKGLQALKVPHLRLYTASYGGQLLAGIIVVLWGGRATYLYGASSSRRREFMPNHLLQWTAICASRESGAVEYDMFGLPGRADPRDPMYGLWRFKTGFGGNLVHYLGAWDLPLKPARYRIFRGLERGKKGMRSIFPTKR